ncbi:unnamed protein product [Ostreobium quekettii]|uniref:Uncharacterized protein n=1 Tax=Ostreobium quekettii TaxID=121088 RepID=A0A8S1J9Q7_9CHLO|nr:unnamed protein product [Ostreobium quekettii]
MKAAATDIPQPDRAVGVFLDEEKLIADMGFPISPDDLIAKAKYALDGGRYLTDEELVDPDKFTFNAPVVGPLSYAEFTTAFKGFGLTEAFPDLQPCIYHFRVDPYQPGRVWFTSRSWGVNTGPLMGGEPTNKVADAPPQNSSFTFSEGGKIVDMTVGYVQDKRLGNQGGLGAAFGMLYAVGKGLPFPEGQPYKISWRFRLVNLLGSITRRLRKGRG